MARVFGTWRSNLAQFQPLANESDGLQRGDPGVARRVRRL